VVTAVDGKQLKATVSAENQRGEEVLKDVGLEGRPPSSGAR
jgi:hypothetical protein